MSALLEGCCLVQATMAGAMGEMAGAMGEMAAPSRYAAFRSHLQRHLQLGKERCHHGCHGVMAGHPG